MRIKIILFIFLIIGCNSNRNLVSNKKTEKNVAIKLISHAQNGETISLEFLMTNNTTKPISILKPTYWDNWNLLYPEFFELEFHPLELNCDYAPGFEEINLKEVNYIEIIEPNDSIKFKINSNSYYKGVCNIDAKELKIVLKYKPDLELFIEEVFLNKFKNSTNKKELYNVLKDTYQDNIFSDTIKIPINQ